MAATLLFGLDTTSLFDDALQVYRTAPRLEPLTREMQDLLMGQFKKLENFGYSGWGWEVLEWIGRGEAATAVRCPQLCALMSDNMLNAAVEASDTRARTWGGTPQPGEVELWMAITRAREALEREKVMRLHSNRRKHPCFEPYLAYATATTGTGLPEAVRAELGAIYDQTSSREPVYPFKHDKLTAAMHQSYIYTDPASGMQRVHDPTNLADLRREVRLPASTKVGIESLRSMAFAALAASKDMLRVLLPESLMGELEARRKVVMEIRHKVAVQMDLAQGHTNAGRAMHAATHTRNALAYKQQL